MGPSVSGERRWLVWTAAIIVAGFWQEFENFAYFRSRKLNGPVVQWIEYWIPVPAIWVRVPSGSHFKTANLCKARVCGFFVEEMHPRLQPFSFSKSSTTLIKEIFLF